MTDEKQNGMPDVIWAYAIEHDEGDVDFIDRQWRPYKGKTGTKYHRTLTDEEFEGLKMLEPKIAVTAIEKAQKSHIAGRNACLDELREKGMI